MKLTMLGSELRCQPTFTAASKKSETTFIFINERPEDVGSFKEQEKKLKEGRGLGAKKRKEDESA